MAAISLTFLFFVSFLSNEALFNHGQKCRLDGVGYTGFDWVSSRSHLPSVSLSLASIHSGNGHGINSDVVPAVHDHPHDLHTSGTNPGADRDISPGLGESVVVVAVVVAGSVQ